MSLCEHVLTYIVNKVAQNHNSYRKTREKEDYLRNFPEVLESALNGSTSNIYIGDGGGGEGIAMREILLMSPHVAGATVISLEEPESIDLPESKDDLLMNGRYRHITGRKLEKISPEELGLFSIWLDVMGAFAYSNRPDLFVQKYLRTLARNGQIFIHAGEDRENPSYVRVGNININILDWLQSIGNIEVKKIADGSRVLRVKNWDEPIVIPGLRLRRVKWTKKRPIIRYFVIDPRRAVTF